MTTLKSALEVVEILRKWGKHTLLVCSSHNEARKKIYSQMEGKLESTTLDMSIVIPCKDDWRIFHCIESIDEDVEIIVVLNGSPDALREKLAQTDVKLCILPDPNLGKALDVGIHAATRERVLLMDSDCIFEKGCIRQLYDGLKPNSVSKGKVVFRYRGWLSFVMAQSRDHLVSARVAAYKPPLAIWKSSLSSIGGYYFHHNIYWREDAELDFRIRRAGIDILLYKDAIIYHDSLKLFQDLRSAFRYGTGQSAAKRLELELAGAKSTVSSTFRSKGFFPGCYMGLFKTVYRLGYIIDRMFNVYKIEKR